MCRHNARSAWMALRPPFWRDSNNLRKYPWDRNWGRGASTIPSLPPTRITWCEVLGGGPDPREICGSVSVVSAIESAIWIKSTLCHYHYCCTMNMLFEYGKDWKLMPDRSWSYRSKKFSSLSFSESSPVNSAHIFGTIWSTSNVMITKCFVVRDAVGGSNIGWCKCHFMTKWKCASEFSHV